ncbi:hypothetical protein ERJ75_000134200 [Trypanosoma vivax]|uniref:Uncharacterized protein n=1 Tax=Trypanosoma vivax (strain Y486) TaxID=1055687 RepID=G0TT26_TRYVY|nr:hypothetical protein TRVL_02490 [Trypanosoma vivax]KAH8619684.1 hypothetical protein ERJ75_000134200 [Trypanosoma vivax]CCC47107.1 conserved hypothetical protein [Trypanosoma vivax Y486]
MMFGSSQPAFSSAPGTNAGVATGATPFFGAVPPGVVGAGATSFGSFGANKGFGITATPGGQPQIPPYKGIKGPGFSAEWPRLVNLSTIRDDVVFEDLPPPLQHHLIELHNFVQAEHTAKQFVKSFLADSVGPEPGAAASYRSLSKNLCRLLNGKNAVDGIRVDCFERESQSNRLGHILDKCEEEVHNYIKHVWEPMSEEDFTQRRTPSGSESSEPFFSALCEIQTYMKEVSSIVSELEAALLPDGRRRKVPGTDNDGKANAVLEQSRAALPHLSRFHAVSEPCEASAGSGSPAITNPVAQVNSSLNNELTALLNLATWTLQLHSRAEDARDLFVHMYGASEAEILFSQNQQRNAIGPKRPFALPLRSKAATKEDGHTTIGDIHRRSIGLDRLARVSSGERKMQYDVLLDRQRHVPLVGAPPTAPAGLNIPVASTAPAVTVGAAPTNFNTAPALLGSTAPPSSRTGTGEFSRHVGKKGRQ